MTKYISIGIVAIGTLLMGFGFIIFAIANAPEISKFFAEASLFDTSFVLICSTVTITCGVAGFRWGDFKLF